MLCLLRLRRLGRRPGRTLWVTRSERTPAESLAPYGSPAWTINGVRRAVDTVPDEAPSAAPCIHGRRFRPRLSAVRDAGWLDQGHAPRRALCRGLIMTVPAPCCRTLSRCRSTEVLPRNKPAGGPRTKPISITTHAWFSPRPHRAVAGYLRRPGLAGGLPSRGPTPRVLLVWSCRDFRTGAVLVRLETSEQRPTDWAPRRGSSSGPSSRLALSPLPLIGDRVSRSMTVSLMLGRVTHEIDHATQMRIACRHHHSPSAPARHREGYDGTIECWLRRGVLWRAAATRAAIALVSAGCSPIPPQEGTSVSSGITLPGHHNPAHEDPDVSVSIRYRAGSASARAASSCSTRQPLAAATTPTNPAAERSGGHSPSAPGDWFALWHR